MDLVEVSWPSGAKQSFYQITEGSDSLSLQKIVDRP